MKRNILIISCLFFLALQSGLSFDGVPPSRVIIGSWTMDMDSIRNSHEFQEILNNTPPEQTEMVDAMLAMFAGFKMIITEETMTAEMEIFGEKQVEITRYKIISESGNTLSIVNMEDDDSVSEVLMILIIDNNHIQLTSEDDPEPFPMIFKRVG